MNHDQGIINAINRASRDRLVRFINYVDPGAVHWHDGKRVGPESLSEMTLRTTAFCAASDFWLIRKKNRFWRTYPQVPSRVPEGCTVVPNYSGPPLDAWRQRFQAIGALDDRHPLPIAAE